MGRIVAMVLAAALACGCAAEGPRELTASVPGAVTWFVHDATRQVLSIADGQGEPWPDDGPPMVAIVGREDSVRLRAFTGPCPQRLDVTIALVAGRYAVEIGEGSPPCQEASAKFRSLTLTFDRAVDPATFDVTEG